MATRRIYYDEYGDAIALPARRPEPRGSFGATLFNLLSWCSIAVLLAFLVGALGPAFGVRVPYLADAADAVRARMQAPARCQINGADVPCAEFERLNNIAATAAARNPAAPVESAPTPQVELRVIGPDGIRDAAPAAPVEAAAPVVLESAAPVEAAPAFAPALPQLAQEFVEAVQPPVAQPAPPAAGSVCLAYRDGRCPAAVVAPVEAAPQPAPVEAAAPRVGAQAFLDAVAGPTPAPRVCLAYRDGVCPAGGGK